MQLLLNIGMGGSSVNIGSCALHIVKNPLYQGMNVLEKHVIDLDQFDIDLLFSQQSSAYRKDFKEVCSIANVASLCVLQHCQTRWLSTEKVLELLNSLVMYILILSKSCQNKIPLKGKWSG